MNIQDDEDKEVEKDEDDVDENGIDDSWDFEELMANKTFLFGTKYRWNFCSTYFKEENLEHIYSASWAKPSKQKLIKYDSMLTESIQTVTKYHSKTMEKELIQQFKDFSNNFRIQFSDQILLFNGMTEGREVTNEKGRSVRVGFFRKNKENDTNTNKNKNTDNNKMEENKENDQSQPNEDEIMVNNGDKLEMIVCYADNKQFVAECQQFFGLKIDDFQYESRKWALAEEPAWTDIKGNVDTIYKKWMDIGLIIGISIINRLLNPSLPQKSRINSIYRQELFDVTDLLPPFDDIQSLLKNDDIWWNELEKRIEREEQISKTPSEASSYQDSLKDFIDNSYQEDQIPIEKALMCYGGLAGLVANNNNNNNDRGMMMPFLENIKEYNEENDADYQDDGEDDDEEDYEKYVDESITDDFVTFIRENKQNTNDNNGTTKTNRKRKIDQINANNVETIAKDDNDKIGDDQPPSKKRKVDESVNIEKKNKKDQEEKIDKESDGDLSSELSETFEESTIKMGKQ